MTVKLSLAPFAKAMAMFNGLNAHTEVIKDYELDATGDDRWSGVAVVQLRAVQVPRISGTGEYVPEVQIVAIELGEGAHGRLLQQLYDEIYAERGKGGTLLDPEMIGGTPDPYENPDTAPARHDGRSVRTVDIPDGMEGRDPHHTNLRGARAEAERRWSSADGDAS